MAFLGGSFEPVEPIGNTINKTLGQTLQSLAQHKLNQRHSQELEKLGFPKELAAIYHKLDPKVQEGIFKQVDLSRIGQLQGQSQQNQMQQVQPQPTFTPEQVDYIKSIPDANERQRVARQFQVQNYQQQDQQQFNPQQQVTPNQQIGQIAGQQQIAQQLSQQQNPNSIFQQQSNSKNDLISKEDIASQTRRKIVAEKYYEEKLNQGEEAERKLSILNKMEQLVPKVSGGTRSNLASLTGTRALITSPETSEFDKLSADLLPQGLTQEQLRSERLKFPHAGLPAKANEKLIKELKNKYIRDIGESKTAESIIEANGGQIPNDFRKQLHYANKSEIEFEPKKKEVNKNLELELSKKEKPEDQEEGFLSSVLRNVIGAGANAISSLAHLPSLPENLAKHAERTRNNMVRNALKPGNEANLYGSDPEKTKKALEKLEDNPIKGVVTPVIEKAHDIAKSAFPKGYLQPKNESEEVFQDYAAMIPLFILSGGSANIKDIAGFIGRTAVGREVGNQVKESGGGEIGRITSEIAIPALLSAMNPYRVAREFKGIQNKDYNETLPKVAGNQFVNAKPLEDALEEASQIGRRSAGRKRHLDNINDWSKEISNGDLPLSRLQPLKKEVNKLAYQQNNEAYKPIAVALKKMGENTLKTHPEYGNALHRADSIHQIYANAEDMKDFIKDSTRSIPVKKAYLIKKGIDLLLHNPAVEGAKTLVKLGVKFPKETTDYALKSFVAATKKQTPAFLKEVEKLGRLVEEVEKE